MIGNASHGSDERAALRHDRIVGRVLDACPSVVPFRVGVELRSETELLHVLEANEKQLTRHLARFRGRVEMGLKVKLATHADGELRRLLAGLGRVRALAPLEEDRREGSRRASSGHVFEGCYLIPRRAVDAFWSAAGELHRTFPDLPLLGSGPWAAYSFCDLALQPAQGESRVALAHRHR